MISKSCKYGIRAALFVASRFREEKKYSVKEIAEHIDAPEAFTAKILQNLTRHRIITSLKGPYGGFYIEDHQLKIPLIHIVNAIDGLNVFHECGLGLKQCSDKHPCPFHDGYKAARSKMLKIFNDTTIGQLAKSLNKGNAFLTA